LGRHPFAFLSFFLLGMFYPVVPRIANVGGVLPALLTAPLVGTLQIDFHLSRAKIFAHALLPLFFDRFSKGTVHPNFLMVSVASVSWVDARRLAKSLPPHRLRHSSRLGHWSFLEKVVRCHSTFLGGILSPPHSRLLRRRRSPFRDIQEYLRRAMCAMRDT